MLKAEIIRMWFGKCSERSKNSDSRDGAPTVEPTSPPDSTPRLPRKPPPGLPASP